MIVIERLDAELGILIRGNSETAWEVRGRG